MDYAILHNDMLPLSLQSKPRWVKCMVCTAALLVITLSAVTVGAFVGYTYCYVEHRTSSRKDGNFQSANVDIFSLPSESKDKSRTTINSVLFSSVLISRLIEIGQSLRDDFTRLPWTNAKSGFPVIQNATSSNCLQK